MRDSDYDISSASTNFSFKKRNKWNKASLFFTIISLVPLFEGFNKLFEYSNSESNPVNVYVGGDAYNYIINANYATAYFVLCGICILIAIGCGVMYYLKEIKNSI